MFQLFLKNLWQIQMSQIEVDRVYGDFCVTLFSENE